MAGLDPGDSQEWYYLDSTGQEFGPFPSLTMRGWFTQGFFPSREELLVRLPSWKSPLPLRMIYSDINDAFGAPPRLNQGPSLGQAPPPPEYGGGYLPDRRLYDPMPGGGLHGGPCGAPLPPQSCSGYYMMPPGPGPAPYPGPPAAGPGAYMMPMVPAGQGALTGRFEGRIKSYNAKQGFGFIECPEAHAIFGRDVFLHKGQIGDLKVGTPVTYGVEMNRRGMPQARDLATLDGQPPGPSPDEVAKGGKPAGPGGKGKGGKQGGDGKGGYDGKGGKGRRKGPGGKGPQDGDDNGFGGFGAGGCGGGMGGFGGGRGGGMPGPVQPGYQQFG